MIVEGETVARQVVARMEAQKANSPEILEQQAKMQQAQADAKRAELQRLINIRAGQNVADPKEAAAQARQDAARAAENAREVKIILKTVRGGDDSFCGPRMLNALQDVSGSLEAVQNLLAAIPQDEVKLTIIRTGFGNVSEVDIDLAQTMGADVVLFNVNVPAKARSFAWRSLMCGSAEFPQIRSLAERNKVSLPNHSIVYQLLDDVRDRMEKQLPRDRVTAVEGDAEVLQLFPIKVAGRKAPVIVAGCRVTKGTIARKLRVQGTPLSRRCYALPHLTRPPQSCGRARRSSTAKSARSGISSRT